MHDAPIGGVAIRDQGAEDRPVERRKARRSLRDRWLAALMRPPGLPFNGVMLLALIWTAAAASDGVGSGVRGLLVWGPLGCIWVVRVAVYSGLGADRDATLRTVARWAAAPAVAVVAAWLAVSGVAFDARFRLSEPALRALAMDAQAGRPAAPGWHGLFDVREIGVGADGVVVRLRGGSTLRSDASGPATGRRVPAPGWVAGRRRGNAIG